ncbi:MAG TPA: acyl carrier protein [Methanocorpusculum sp.]|nr:acyl carrier protein [Methanocorpusculum sp.]
MDNLEKYNQVFLNVLGISENELNESLIYQSVSSWDSVGHMELIAEMEEQFGIMLETDDIIDFSSYAKGKEILNKYNITF